MGLNRNHEGYHDPTACEAVRRSRKPRKKQPHLWYLSVRLNPSGTQLRVNVGL